MTNANLDAFQMWDLLCKIADLHGDPDPDMDGLNRDGETLDLLVRAGVLQPCSYCDLHHRDREMCPQYPTLAEQLAASLQNGNYDNVGTRLLGQADLTIDVVLALIDQGVPASYAVEKVKRALAAAGG